MVKPTKEQRISARVSGELKERLTTISRARRVDEADLVRDCVIALCDYYDRYGTIPRDLAIRPADSELERMRRQVQDHDRLTAEDATPYAKTKAKKTKAG